MRGKTKSYLRGRKSFTALFSVSLLFSVLAQSSGIGIEPNFVATEIHQATEPIYGLAWGEFDPLHAGMEAACLLNDGSVLQLSPNVPSWDTAQRHSGLMNIGWMGARPTIGIGDVYSGNPGNEIVIEGPSGTGSLIVIVFHDPALGWTSGLLFDSRFLQGGSWGARVGDFDPRSSGDEIFHIFELVMDLSDGTVIDVVGPSWPTWSCEEELVYSGGVGMDSAVGDFNLDRSGPEIVLVTEFGPAYEILPPDGDWTGLWPKRTIWTDFPNAGWVVEIADVDPCYAGNEIVYGTRYSNRILMSRHDGNQPHDLQILFTGNATGNNRNMWDISVGDILADSPGLEILGVDKTGSVYLVRRIEDSWQGQVIWQDPNGQLYAVVAGDFLPARSGDEILVAGEAGAITLLTLTFTDNIAGDGTVNFEDFAEVAQYWRQDESSADIGPWPIGDGVVDMRDVAVLAEDWLKTAYWVE